MPQQPPAYLLQLRTCHRFEFANEKLGDLQNYGFVSPTGAPFDEILKPLMQENIDPAAARRLCNGLESTYQFHMFGSPLTNVVEWIELRRMVGAPSEK